MSDVYTHNMQCDMKMKMIAAMAALLASVACQPNGNNSNANNGLPIGSHNESVQAAADPVASEPKMDRDLIYSNGDKAARIDYWAVDDQDVIVSSWPAVITMDGGRVDTCVFKGFNLDFSSQGRTLKVAMGVDTLYYDLERLPSAVRPARSLAAKRGDKEHFYSRRFQLNDSSSVCIYTARIFLPEDAPLWHKQLATIILNYNELKDYNAVRSTGGKIGGVNPDNSTMDEIIRHFAFNFEQNYLREFHDDEFGFQYCDLIEMQPVWQSADGKLITYRFFKFYHLGGIHGFYEEKYVTFDSATGVALGFDDLIEPADFQKACDAVGRQLLAWHDNPQTRAGAALDLDDWNSAVDTFGKERHGDKAYPRPALTANGIVFSYQPYEKGVFSDGVAHCVIPYGLLRLKSRP